MVGFLEVIMSIPGTNKAKEPHRIRSIGF